MILPSPQDLTQFKKFPVTISILALNILLFFLFFDRKVERKVTHEIYKPASIRLTGDLFLQALPHLTSKEKETVPDWIFQINRNNQDQLELVGLYSLKSAGFLEYAKTAPFLGDQIEIENWRITLIDFVQFISRQPLFNYGLNPQNSSYLGFLTYQFSHSGLVHLFNNMMFLVFIGFAVEYLVGGLGLIFLFLLSGLFGGLLFLWLNHNSHFPMVGASASVSGLIAFYCAAETRWRIKYFYFFSPFKDHYGYIYLSPILLAPMYVLVDFTHFLETPDGLNVGVAYSAHIGGSIFGLISGLFFRYGGSSSLRWGKAPS